ncbi:putative membrane protein [Agromyces flavus]|uniref:Membrane protein n=1 Tax=Agromyces flavus TaxID=589382 RepID=A0A1H1YN53_9MICO|nr:DUF998 domain-containing protein [Agromyces flavus]MCP2366744.1 putative membrane protein [Agromyces flavus]GGI45287.1 hypothetical protein GCM10010932_08880 [Agromyces flavus]SDT22810.1 hypothetical protein SAMN04489721_2819 [Agromyces flavus]
MSASTVAADGPGRPAAYEPAPSIPVARASSGRRLAVETEAVVGGVFAASASGLVAAVTMSGQVWPLWGGWSVGAAAAIAVLVSGLVLGAIGYWRSRDLPGQEWRRGLRPWKFSLDVGTVSAVHAIIGGILAVVTFAMLQRSFEGLVVDGLTATGATAASAGLAGYWIFLSVSSITTNRLATLLVFFMASATLASMATAQDPQWWEYHFSQLGTAGDFSSGLFNLALIVAGAFVTTFALYVDRDLTTLVRQGVLVNAWAPRFVSVVFIVMGVMLAGVGLFPLTVSVALHNSCAIGMSLSFLVLLASSPWTLKGMPARFFWFCAGAGALVVGGALLFEPVGYYNLTAFELLAFATIFGWISVFIRFENALTDGPEVAPAGAPYSA